jgi:GNAT superfamily N-acetyltransferase
MADDDLPVSGTNAWYHRQGELPGQRWRVRCIFSGHHPDGTTVTDPGDIGDAYVLWQADVDDQARPVISVNESAIAGAPVMWFVALPDPGAARPAMTLVGYEHDVLASGTVIADTTFFHLPVRNEDQVGAIRWWPEESTVDQVYVSDAYRRRHVATALIYAASAYHQLHGWPGRLHSDGRRTALGEDLVAGLRHPDRIAPLAFRMDPLDPAGPDGHQRGPS